jgi:hypothetical protein
LMRSCLTPCCTTPHDEDHIHSEAGAISGAHARARNRVEATRRRAALSEVLHKLTREDPCFSV